jgi:hypothetical protein
MMVSPERYVALLACGLCLGAAAMAEEERPPDAEFLEYLGMWDETDEDWVLLDEITLVENMERSDPVPEGEESTETEDES